MRIAIIDLGTNTCNLLIAELINPGYKILHKSKQLVNIGEKGTKENQISSEAIERILNAINSHKQFIDKYNVNKVGIIATSAIRSAINKISLLEKISETSGWIVKVISGEQEAELIFNGVLLALNEIKRPSIILDIGGGSNELIIAFKRQLLWKESQPTGMARIINKFSISGQLHDIEIDILKNYFKKKHHEAIKQCKYQNVKTLIGCSGAFDTIADIIDKINPEEEQRKRKEILLQDFYKIYELLIHSTKEQRFKIKGMDIMRINLIVPSIIFISTMIEEIGITKILQTSYALGEGALYKIMDNYIQ